MTSGVAFTPQQKKARRRFFNCSVKVIDSVEEFHARQGVPASFEVRQEQDESFAPFFDQVAQRYQMKEPVLLYRTNRLYKSTTPRTVRMSQPSRGRCTIYVFRDSDLYKKCKDEGALVQDSQVDGSALEESEDDAEFEDMQSQFSLLLRFKDGSQQEVSCSADWTIQQVLEKAGVDPRGLKVISADGELLSHGLKIRDSAVEDEDMLSVE